MDNRPTGFSDSGVDELTVVHKLTRQLPHEEIVYIGDSVKAPYDPRPAEQTREYTWELVNFPLTQNTKMTVFACNTAIAIVWKGVKEKLGIPTLGVILPGSNVAIKSTCNGKVGVIGTPMTIKSDIYHQKIKSLTSQMNVTSLSCPKFAPLVESNGMTSSVAKKVVYETLAPLVSRVGTLVFGYTYYPLLRPVIQNVMGPNVKLIDSGAKCIRDVSVLLNYFEINRNRTQDDVTYAFYTTVSSQSSKEIAVNWLARDIDVQYADSKELNKQKQDCNK